MQTYQCETGGRTYTITAATPQEAARKARQRFVDSRAWFASDYPFQAVVVDGVEYHPSEYAAGSARAY